MAEEFNLADQLNSLTRTQRGDTIAAQEDVLLKCVSAEHTVSAQKGTHGIKYTGRLMEGPDEGEEVEGTAWWSTRTKNSVPFFLGQLEALGVSSELAMSGASLDDLAKRMPGRFFKGNISLDKPKGGGRARNQLIANEAVGEDGAEEATDLGGGEDDLGGLDEFTAPPTPADDPSDDGSAPDPDGVADDKPVPLAADDAGDFWDSPAPKA